MLYISNIILYLISILIVDWYNLNSVMLFILICKLIRKLLYIIKITLINTYINIILIFNIIYIYIYIYIYIGNIEIAIISKLIASSFIVRFKYIIITPNNINIVYYAIICYK